MNNTLLGFRNLAIASGIEKGDPSLARSLQSTVNCFAELVKNSTHESDVEEVRFLKAVPTKSKSDRSFAFTGNANFVKQDEENPVLSTEGFAVEQPRPSNPRRRAAAAEPHPAAMLGYQTTLEGEVDDYDGEIPQQLSGTQAHWEKLPRLSDWTSTEAMQQHPTETPEDFTLSAQQRRFQIPNTTSATDSFMTTEPALMFGQPMSFREKSLYDFYTLPLPSSYSHQETSFARRLLRNTFEESYRIMTDPNSRSEDRRRFCKFTWCFASSPMIIDHMEKTMAKTAKDNLEMWQAPQLHLGGAGLHFPRVGIDAGGAPPAWWADEAPMGPWVAGQPETPPVPSSMAISEIIQAAGMEGEWFDANDVEQYLRSKGLLLDGQSQMVEITDTDDLVPELIELQAPSATSPGASSSIESSGGPRSPPNPDLLWSSDPFLQSADYLWSNDVPSVPEIPDVNMDFSYPGYTDLKAFVPPLDFDLNHTVIPTFNLNMKKFVNVEKFLNGVSRSFIFTSMQELTPL